MPSLNQPHILQVFVGRITEASVINHSGQVIKRMIKFPWDKWRDQWQLTHLYLTGLFDTGHQITVNQEEGMDLTQHSHRLPSPFAIINHQHLNPVIGTLSDLHHLCTHIHHHQLKILVDFVPNHTSIFHPWVKHHPDWYHQKDGRIQTEFSGDVAKLNYDHPDCYQAMKSTLKYLLSLPIDGVRADMAHLIPINFWQDSLQLLQPHQIAIAEAYVDSPFNLSGLEQLINAGFNYVYDEISYRNLVNHNDSGIISHLDYLKTTKYAPNYLHYLSNHDQSLPCDISLVPKYQQLFSRYPGALLSYLPTLLGRPSRIAHHFFDPVSVLTTS